MKPLWIDTDLGFDDMLAILMVCQSDRPVIGCSLVFGNCLLEQVCRNAASMAELFTWEFPIHAGAATPIVGPLETATRILGDSGLPTLGRTLPQPSWSDPGASAFDALTQVLKRSADRMDILALGPLTNLAILRLARPDLYARIGSITWMGGGVGHGNHTRSAEFNAFADPEAVTVVAAGGVPLRIIDLDVCRQVLVTPRDLDGLKAMASDRAALLHDLFGGYINIGMSRGRQAMALYDPVAAAAAISNEAVTFTPVHVAVELSGGLTRGRTVVDDRAGAPHNAELGIRADAEKIRELAVTALRKAAAE